MMENAVIKISEYCSYCEIDPNFVGSLEAVNLIRTVIIDGERYLYHDQLKDLETYATWHYEMDINIEGIDALRHMLDRFKRLQAEVDSLKKQLRVYDPNDY